MADEAITADEMREFCMSNGTRLLAPTAK